MARFNYLAFLYVVLAACAVNVSQSAPVHLTGRQSEEPTRVIISGRPSEDKTGQVGNAGNQTEAVELPGKPLEVKVKTTSLQCNIARAVIITDLQDTAVLLEKIDTSNSTVAKAVSDAKEGVKTAGVAIQGILTALIAGETPPADGRNQTDKGLGIMLTSIKGLESDDEDVKTTLLKIEDTIAAGDEVVATCR
ncbi:hypothetical protein PQX77_017463 [Marasmius sp. AFHP31]|nr:hypothetical protein PQX77_017463 [Marasmius sp. AFHP31]